MKVLHVVGGYPTTKKPHNQVFIKKQIESLISADINCEVCVLEGRGILKYLIGWFKIRKLIKSICFDLIHAHFAYCGFISLGHGLPVVTSFLGSDTYGYPRHDGGYPFFSRIFHKNLSQYVAFRSKESIVKSSKMKSYLGMNLHVVPNGVDCAKFQPVPQSYRDKLRRKLGLETDTKYILFVGDPKRLCKRYNLALESVQIAKHKVHFTLKLLTLYNRPHDEIAFYMQACDIFLLTSSNEGSPNVVKEALATNMAVVSVDVGDVRERIEGVSGCRVTDDDHSETIGHFIAELLLSSEKREGRKAVESISMEAVAAKIITIYNGVLRSPKCIVK